MKYNTRIVQAFWKSIGIPPAMDEYQFDSARKWRFDFAWPMEKVALEVDGGIWVAGRHNRGAAMKATWEKENTAICQGWRILRCEPGDLLKTEMAFLIGQALNYSHRHDS